MPGYWRDETSGLLAPAVGRFLRGKDLTWEDMAPIRAYLRQWLAGDFMGASVARLRREIDVIQTRGDLEHWVAWALDEGIDPF